MSLAHDFKTQMTNFKFDDRERFSSTSFLAGKWFFQFSPDKIQSGLTYIVCSMTPIIDAVQCFKYFLLIGEDEVITVRHQSFVKPFHQFRLDINVLVSLVK